MKCIVHSKQIQVRNFVQGLQYMRVEEYDANLAQIILKHYRTGKV